MAAAAVTVTLTVAAATAAAPDVGDGDGDGTLLGLVVAVLPLVVEPELSVESSSLAAVVVDDPAEMAASAEPAADPP